MQMQFDGQQYPYASRRRVVYGRRGMVCTSQPLSSQAGLQILQQGGNAIDAAIATAICQTVVEPTNNGLGSDCFAIVWVKNKLYGINGSGYAPQNLTAEAVRAAGHTDKMPFRGWQAVTVPGRLQPGRSCTSVSVVCPLRNYLPLLLIMRKTVILFHR